ncbi:rhodanese family protein [Parvularcula oceani]|uniref:rhodanese family protein n=1 Tax=Parvularcula oceani TaxID=1247963 RepID=UPI0004E27BE9|nr:rhodanese family protein [Parvularcula oceani]
MNAPTKITAQDIARQAEAERFSLVDIREPDEFRREHAAGAICLPLSALRSGEAELPAGRPVLFMCRSGMRTQDNAALLGEAVRQDGFLLEGGLQAWKAAGLPTREDRSAPLEIMRQVQIAAGTLVLLGVALGLLLHPGFYGIPAFVGAGLTVAGVTGWCGMARLLGAMPWNRPRAV